MAKGSARERELNATFTEAGFGSIRIPGSGSGTTDDLPDLLVGKREDGLSDLFAIEAKYRGNADSKSAAENKKIYLTTDEVEALERVAADFGATPLLACRWATTIAGIPRSDAEWFLAHPDDVPQTDSGKSYRADYDVASEEWVRLDDFIAAETPEK